MKHAIWDICMSENTCLQIRNRGFSIEFERAIRGVKIISIFPFHENFMQPKSQKFLHLETTFLMKNIS